MTPSRLAPNRGLTFTALAFLVLVGGCEVTEPPVPVPGQLTVQLTSPGATDGALMLRISGPDLSAAEPAVAGYSTHARVVDGALRVAVFGDIAPGALVRFAVPDVARADRYRAELLEVASPDNALRPELTGYSLVVTR